MTGRALLCGALAVAASAGACVPAAGPSDVPPSPIAAVHRRKCSKCHALPEPKTRSRAHLEDALGRHRTRVVLSEAEWRAMVDYLAKPET